jgi:hypothetical protein
MLVTSLGPDFYLNIIQPFKLNDQNVKDSLKWPLFTKNGINDHFGAKIFIFAQINGPLKMAIWSILGVYIGGQYRGPYWGSILEAETLFFDKAEKAKTTDFQWRLRKGY